MSTMRQTIHQSLHGYGESVIATFVLAIIGAVCAVIGTMPTIQDYTQQYLIGPPLPSIKTIEIFMDDNAIAESEIYSKPLHLSKFVALMADKPVLLRVMVTDTTNELYRANEIKCRWSVAPSNKSINSDKCEIVFIPEKKYSKQVVGVVIMGGQKFKPVPTISMEFDIKSVQ